MGKAGGVAFGEAIVTKPFDLIETAMGKFSVIPTPDHAPHHFVLEHANGHL